MSDKMTDKEVEWYQANGRYSARIKRDNLGAQYVVGDWSWHRQHTNEEEYIEEKMSKALSEQLPKAAPHFL